VISKSLFIFYSSERVLRLAGFIAQLMNRPVEDANIFIDLSSLIITCLITPLFLFGSVYFFPQDILDHALIKSIVNFIHSTVNYLHALIDYPKAADVNISKPTDIQSSELVPFSDKYIKALDN